MLQVLYTYLIGSSLSCHEAVASNILIHHTDEETSLRHWEVKKQDHIASQGLTMISNHVV